jgi:hypothetical protein
MTVSVKTVLIYKSFADQHAAMMYTNWKNLLPLDKEFDSSDTSVLSDLTVTRYWTSKEYAQEYIDLMSAELTKINITPELFILEIK